MKERDPYAEREIYLFISNTQDCYFKMVIPYLESLAKKSVRGVYDREKALKGWETCVIRPAVQLYKRWYGDGMSFSAEAKRAIAKELDSTFRDLKNEMIRKAKKAKRTK